MASTQRANLYSKVSNPFCRLPLPTLFQWPEAAHLGDLMRLSVRSGTDHFKKRRRPWIFEASTAPLQTPLKNGAFFWPPWPLSRAKLTPPRQSWRLSPHQTSQQEKNHQKQVWRAVFGRQEGSSGHQTRPVLRVVIPAPFAQPFYRKDNKLFLKGLLTVSKFADKSPFWCPRAFTEKIRAPLGHRILVQQTEKVLLLPGSGMLAWSAIFLVLERRL